MRISAEDLESYSSPYGAQWRKEFADYLVNVDGFSGSSEEFFQFLLTDILPYVRHQDSIYDSSIAVFRLFSEMLARGSQYADDMMYFLGYVFRDYIRDAANILVEPYNYRYLSPPIHEIAPSEARLFDQFVDLYQTYRGSGISNKSQVYFDCVLLKRSPGPFDRPGESSGEEVDRYGWTRFLADVIGLRNHWVSSPSADELLRAFYKLDPEARQATLLAHLRSVIHEEASVPTPWASGRTGAIISATVLTLTLGEAFQPGVLETILSQCLVLKASRGDEVDFAYLDRFILEDISSILFSGSLGSGIPFDPRTLTQTQKMFLEFLNSSYKGHTYTLLYAGILPQSIAADKIDSVDIYDLS